MSHRSRHTHTHTHTRICRHHCTLPTSNPTETGPPRPHTGGPSPSAYKKKGALHQSSQSVFLSRSGQICRRVLLISRSGCTCSSRGHGARPPPPPTLLANKHDEKRVYTKIDAALIFLLQFEENSKRGPPPPPRAASDLTSKHIVRVHETRPDPSSRREKVF